MIVSSPHLVVLAGPNGAGKSTIAPFLLPHYLGIQEFVNADVIAQGLSAFNSQSTAMQAGKIMLRRLHQLAEQRKNFAFETTLASRSFYPWIQTLRNTGYSFHLLFLWLPSPDLAIARVQERVALGGHDVPEEVIRRRYEAGLKNFFHLYLPITSDWKLFQNIEKTQPEMIASGCGSSAGYVYNELIWNSLCRKYRYGNIKS